MFKGIERAWIQGVSLSRLEIRDGFKPELEFLLFSETVEGERGMMATVLATARPDGL